VLLINQDVYIQYNTVKRLLSFFNKESDIALISPIHLNGVGNALDTGFQSCLTENLCPGFVSDATLKCLKPYYLIHSVNAATWLLDVKVIKKIGLFSPAFYHYGEDINFQQRLKYFGYKAIVVTNAFINHDRDYRMGEKSETGKIHEIKTNQMTLLLNISESYSLTLQKTLKFSGLLLFERKYKEAVRVFFDTIIKKNKYRSWREELKKGIPL
jgi:GT2 family glycosyltransferase